MNQCIKCGRPISDGELFCIQCSKSPVIAELNTPPRHQSAPVRRPAPKAAPVQKKNAGRKPVVILSAILAVVLAILLAQQGSLQAEKNRARTAKEQAQRQIAELTQTKDALADTEEALAKAEADLKSKEQEIKTLSARLADSVSSQNQGAYDMTNLQKEMDTLQEEYDTIKADYDKMAEAVEAAAKYKDKADFLDTYVVFVMNDNSKLYHCYDCEDFVKSKFWTYSPKLAEAQGFKPCSKCMAE